MNHFKKLLKVFIAFNLLAMTTSLWGYDVIDRYVLLEDKFKTDEMLRPYGHDFIIPDIAVWYNADLPTLISDASDLSNSGTDIQKFNKAQDLLAKYNNTEQVLRVAVNFGIPLFTFHAFGLKIVPDIRVGVHLGLNLRIGSEACTFATLEKVISSQGLATSEASKITTALANVSCSSIVNNSAGNLVTAAKATAGFVTTPVLDALETSKQLSLSVSGVTPNLDALPTLDLYAKGEGKANLLFNFFTENNISGYLSFGLLGRADITAAVTSAALANGADIINLGDEMNTTMAFTSDFRVQYQEKDSDWKVYGQVDDLKIAVMSDNKDVAGDLNYEIDPSIRLHGSYTYKFIGAELEAFAGVHKRSRYDFTDGLYTGGDVSMYFWDDRIGFRGRAMLDQEHITISPMIKMWIAQLDLGLKLPAKSTVDGVKVATIYSGNLRIFF